MRCGGGGGGGDGGGGGGGGGGDSSEKLAKSLHKNCLFNRGCQVLDGSPCYSWTCYTSGKLDHGLVQNKPSSNDNEEK